MSNPETISSAERKNNPEAIKEAGDKRRELLHQELLERAGEHHESIDDARREVEKAANMERQEKEKKTAELDRPLSPAERRNDSPIGTAKRDASFNATMEDIHTHMSPSSRAFSKVIHNKAVENISDVGASTIARPNAILSGAVFAFILTLGVYLVAKNLGYPLSGFETIGAFIIGWVLGVIYDFLKVMVTGRK